MSKADRNTLRLAIGKDLALEAQSLCEQQGVPLNVTQAVKALLTVGIQTKHATLMANKVRNNDNTKSHHRN
jgi:hypothetical protein|tara:strand:+ start:2784 stop:2996 length:213 start_codon:yes stop_codon:yes gene_type:complete